jgi:triacylglycerol lipase
MATYQSSWDALTKPGDSTTYFDRPVAPLDPKARGWSAPNAWWLIELSRLIYKVDPQARQEVLRRAGFQEIPLMLQELAQASVIWPSGPTPASFAAVVFRGTHDLTDVKTDGDIGLEPWSGPGLVHRGFEESLDAIWPDLEKTLRQAPFSTLPLLFTGHSLGAALATLAAARLVQEDRPPSALYTFGSPRVGNAPFASSLGGIPVFRVVDGRDIIARVPLLFGYTDVGEPHLLGSGYPTPGGVEEELAVLGSILKGGLDQWVRDQRAAEGPLEFLADHAPINYVADLEPQL